MMERREAVASDTRRVQVLAFAVLAGFLAVAALYFAVHSQGGGKTATSSNSYSAIGFKAFAELLERSGYQVHRNRVHSPRLNADQQVGIIAGPRWHEDLTQAFERFAELDIVLVVLPKWTEGAESDPGRLVEYPKRHPLLFQQNVLDEINKSYRMGSLRVDFSNPPSANSALVDPTIIDAQLISYDPADQPGSAVKIYRIDGKNQALLITVRRLGQSIWILAYPDPISNHGIGTGNNALFALQMMERIAAGRKTVIFDEVINGDVMSANVYELLFERPWFILVLVLLALFAAIGLTAASRFGTAKEDAVGVAAGRVSLVRATAQITVRKDNGRSALVRYLHRSISEVAAARRAPAGSAEEQATWLDAMAAQRGWPADAVALYTEIPKATAERRRDRRLFLRHARAIYRWKTEMLNDRR